MPALQTRFMSASTTLPPSTLMNFGVLAADLDDAQASTAFGVEPCRGLRVRDDLVLDDEPPPGRETRRARRWRPRRAPSPSPRGRRRGREPSRRPRRSAPGRPRRGCPRCGDRRRPAQTPRRDRAARPWSRWTPRSSPSTAASPRPAMGGGSSSTSTEPGPAEAWARPTMRRRAALSRAAGSAGKRGTSACGGGAAARPPRRVAQRAPSASKTPAFGTHRHRRGRSAAASPRAIGPMSAPWPMSTTGPSALLLS